MEPILLEGHSGHVNSTRFSPDSKKLFSLGFAGELKEWEVGTWKHVRNHEGQSKSINGLVFLDDGKTMITASGDGTICYRDYQTGQLTQTLTPLKKDIYHLRITADKQTLVASTKNIMLAAYKIGEADPFLKLKTIGKNIGVVALSPQGDTAIIGGYNDEIHVYSLPEGTHQHTFKGHPMAMMSFHFLDQGAKAISCGYDGIAKLWDTKTWETIETFPVAVQGGGYLAVSPDQSILAVSMPFAVKVFSLPDVQLIKEVKMPIKGNYGLCFSPDGAWLGMGAADKKARVWKVAELIG